MASLPDDYPIEFKYSVEGSGEKWATVLPSDATMQIHEEVLTARSEGKPASHIASLLSLLDKSAGVDALREANRLNDISRSGTDVPPTASASTNNNPTQNPSPDGTQKPMFGPKRPPSMER